MRRLLTLLLVSVLSGPAGAAQVAPGGSPQRAPGYPAATSFPGPLAAGAAREVGRLTRALAPEPRNPQPAREPKDKKTWIARHPRLFGALIGFGVGCVVGASQVGGSEDTFFNALDEFACPVVGGIGAGAGALVGSLVK